MQPLSLLALTASALALSIPPSPQLYSANSRTIVSNSSSTWPWQTYISTNVTPPYLEINRSAGVSLGPGYIFLGQELDAQTGVKVEAPFILTDYNELVWAGPEGVEASNFRQQFWRDQSVISFWVGTGKAAEGQAAGHGWGEVLIYDNTYKQIKSICLQLNLTLPNGTTTDCDADVHESFITQDDTILLTAYNVSQADLTSLGGPSDGWVYDSIALEYDLKTDEVVFVWSPLAHLPVNLTHVPYTGESLASPFDWFHINSIQKVGDHYLINSRHLWKTFFVNKKGEIVWEIDGVTGGDFGSLPNNVTFVSIFSVTRGAFLMSESSHGNTWPVFTTSPRTVRCLLTLTTMPTGRRLSPRRPWSYVFLFLPTRQSRRSLLPTCTTR
jgi:hypothetical protein